jgi:hypothetical protein
VVTMAVLETRTQDKVITRSSDKRISSRNGYTLIEQASIVTTSVYHTQFLFLFGRISLIVAL